MQHLADGTMCSKQALTPQASLWDYVGAICHGHLVDAKGGGVIASLLKEEPSCLEWVGVSLWCCDGKLDILENSFGIILETSFDG